jgi:hypothetical protein
MQSTNSSPTVMERLRLLGAFVGIGQPTAGDTARDYGVRILHAIDPDDEVFDDVRFRVLVLINQEQS